MSQLTDYTINIKLKLSAIWGSVMSLYIYCDYFDLYTPNKLESMINGTSLFGTLSQGILLGLSSILLVTSLMICLCILLPAKINRIINIVVGVIMTVMLALIVFASGWYFYQMYAAVESALTLYIAYLAWNWPKEEGSENA